jgi:hypothetical protein
MGRNAGTARPTHPNRRRIPRPRPCREAQTWIACLARVTEAGFVSVRSWKGAVTSGIRHPNPAKLLLAIK